MLLLGRHSAAVQLFRQMNYARVSERLPNIFDSNFSLYHVLFITSGIAGNPGASKVTLGDMGIDGTNTKFKNYAHANFIIIMIVCVIWPPISLWDIIT